MNKKYLQTSLRLVRCQLCGNWVLTKDIIRHANSNCKLFILGRENTNPERENKLLLEQKIVNSFYLMRSGNNERSIPHAGQ